MTSATHANPPKVGIVGHSQAGKSTFLAVLMKAFQERGYQVTDEDPSSRSYPRALTSYVSAGFFPPKTPVQDQNRRRISLHVSKQGRNRTGTEGFVIDFFDPAGDIFESQPGGENSQHTDARQQIMEQLEQCTGLLVLIDPQASAQMVERIFTSTVGDLVGRLRRSKDQDRFSGGKLQIPVVILFTKADTLRWQQRYRIRDANDWVRLQPEFQALVANAEDNCERVHFGFCSAAGWHEGQPNYRTLIRPRPQAGRAAEDDPVAMQPDASVSDPSAGAENGAPIHEGEPQTSITPQEQMELQGQEAQRRQAELRRQREWLETDKGEHVPDPALDAWGIHRAASASRDTPAALRFMAGLPVFTDPIRLVTSKAMREPIHEVDDRYGVLNLYGATVRASQQFGDAVLSPWNVAEAVLWAAGLSETGEPIPERRYARKRGNKN